MKKFYNLGPGFLKEKKTLQFLSSGMFIAANRVVNEK